MNVALRVSALAVSLFSFGACGVNRGAQMSSTDSTVAESDPASIDSACSLGEQSPTIVKRDGNSILQFWTIPQRRVFFSRSLPDDTTFLDFRQTIRLANADINPPVADPPQPASENERQMWANEARNVEVAYSGRGGNVRPLQCLDALLFAYQNARYSQISHPTEFIASILRQSLNGQNMLRIYFAGSDTEFPPKGFYGFDEIKQDMAMGWEFWTVLHNHTVQSNNGAPALGVPAPSTSDVDLLRSLSNSAGLQNAWVTNGFYTIEIPAIAFDQYLGR